MFYFIHKRNTTKSTVFLTKIYKKFNNTILLRTGLHKTEVNLVLFTYRHILTFDIAIRCLSSTSQIYLHTHEMTYVQVYWWAVYYSTVGNNINSPSKEDLISSFYIHKKFYSC